MFLSKNSSSLTTKIDTLKSFYRKYPNPVCAAIMFVGLCGFSVAPGFLFVLGSLINLVGYVVMLFAAISRNLIVKDKTKAQRRNFLIVAGLLILFNPLRSLTPFLLLLGLLKPIDRVVRG